MCGIQGKKLDFGRDVSKVIDPLKQSVLLASRTGGIAPLEIIKENPDNCWYEEDGNFEEVKEEVFNEADEKENISDNISMNHSVYIEERGGNFATMFEPETPNFI